MKKLLLLTVLILGFASHALALDLQQARAEGLVTEQPSGYISAAKPSADVNALVDEINSKRKQEYERISKENGQSVEVVAKLAAEQIKAKTSK